MLGPAEKGTGSGASEGDTGVTEGDSPIFAERIGTVPRTVPNPKIGTVHTTGQSPIQGSSRSPGRKSEEYLVKSKAKKAGGRRVLGVFQRTQKGFGFVRSREEPKGRPRRQKDIYIPAERRRRRHGRRGVGRGRRPPRGEPGPRGEIVEVVERQTQQFVGTYLESAGAAYVRIDGALFARPICVGDPGAKNAQPDDKVVIEMLRFPSPLHDGEGVITEVLGPRGRPGVDTLSIIREFGLPDQFAEDAVEEARRRPRRSTNRSAAARTSPARRS